MDRQRSSRDNRAKRVESFDLIEALYASGMPLLTVTNKLGMDWKTVRTYAYAESFSERHPNPTFLTASQRFMSASTGARAGTCLDRCNLDAVSLRNIVLSKHKRTRKGRKVVCQREVGEFDA